MLTKNNEKGVRKEEMMHINRKTQMKEIIQLLYYLMLDTKESEYILKQ